MICDMLETYGVYEPRNIPVQRLAILVKGLKEDSRVKMAISKTSVPQKLLLIAAAVDSLAFIAWTKTKAAEKNTGRPRSVVEMLLNHVDSSDITTFSSAEEFEAAREKLLRGEN